MRTCRPSRAAHGRRLMGGGSFVLAFYTPNSRGVHPTLHAPSDELRTTKTPPDLVIVLYLSNVLVPRPGVAQPYSPRFAPGVRGPAPSRPPAPYPMASAMQPNKWDCLNPLLDGGKDGITAALVFFACPHSSLSTRPRRFSVRLGPSPAV
ncbi:hypothetical protein B0T25DRAFT_151303 [Lasiosphaeria hispida]|uniref:Uncharacterized protein n=1 Tax=Lasiosphaeria hispida TaxID=260671 RepID=A0AAJ0HM15_9PEZI|nr:hypothetical protein B0T25DRAFT_151303 [Lasiosphaeria hispida]